MASRSIMLFRFGKKMYFNIPAKYKQGSYPSIRILFFGTLLLVILLGGAYSFGLVMINELWDPSGWFFMACSIAVV